MEASSDGVVQYLTFAVAREEYAVAIVHIREILELEGTSITKVPSTPPSIRGVINLRGSVVPVIDLAVKFGLPEIVPSRFTCVVLAEIELDGEQTRIGLLVDSVSQVIELGEGDVEPPPSFGTRVRVDYLLGMGKQGKRFVMLLDIPRVLATDGIVADTSGDLAERGGAAAAPRETETAEALAP